jgi:hypothetical protein
MRNKPKSVHPSNRATIHKWWYRGSPVELRSMQLTSVIVRLKDNGQGMPGPWFVIGTAALGKGWLR